MAEGIAALTGLAGLHSMGAMMQAEFGEAKELIMVKHGPKK